MVKCPFFCSNNAKFCLKQKHCSHYVLPRPRNCTIYALQDWHKLGGYCLLKNVVLFVKYKNSVCLFFILLFLFFHPLFFLFHFIIFFKLFFFQVGCGHLPSVLWTWSLPSSFVISLLSKVLVRFLSFNIWMITKYTKEKRNKNQERCKSSITIAFPFFFFFLCFLFQSFGQFLRIDQCWSSIPAGTGIGYLKKNWSWTGFDWY